MCAEGNPKLSEGSDNNLHRQNLSVLWWNMKPWKMLEDEGLERMGGMDGWMMTYFTGSTVTTSHTHHCHIRVRSCTIKYTAHHTPVIQEKLVFAPARKIKASLPKIERETWESCRIRGTDQKISLICTKRFKNCIKQRNRGRRALVSFFSLHD